MADWSAPHDDDGHCRRFEQAQSPIAQRFAVLRFPGLAWPKIHSRPLAQCAIGLLVKCFPLAVGKLGDVDRQRRTHPGADRKANASARFLNLVGMIEPVQPSLLMAGRVATKGAFPDVSRDESPASS